MSTNAGKIYAPIGNYYGSPYVVQEGKKYIFILEDWGGEDAVIVSKAFYEIWKAEFQVKSQINSSNNQE